MGAKCIDGRTFYRQQIEGMRPFCENLTERLWVAVCCGRHKQHEISPGNHVHKDCSHWKLGDQQKKKIIKVDTQINLIKDLVVSDKRSS